MALQFLTCSQAVNTSDLPVNVFVQSTLAKYRGARPPAYDRAVDHVFSSITIKAGVAA
jgi:hypothetical protein